MNPNNADHEIPDMAKTSQPDWKALFTRVCLIFAAFCVAYIIYMVGIMMMPREGMISLIVQPLMAAMASTVIVIVALLTGLLLKLPIVRDIWSSGRKLSISISLFGLLLLCAGYSLGLRSIGIDKTGAQFEMLNPYAAIVGCYLVVFGIVNLPIRLNPKTS